MGTFSGQPLDRGKSHALLKLLDLSWVNHSDLKRIMVREGNDPNMALFQIGRADGADKSEEGQLSGNIYFTQMCDMYVSSV